MLLDIIVTHYDEPIETVWGLLDSIQMQRGVSLEDFRVFLVNDGKENRIPNEWLDGYSFQLQNATIPHGGVSAARNYGIDNSTADWVMFCDCDDMFASIFALRNILTLLDTKDVDILWAPFYVENGKKDSTQEYALRLKGYNLTWIHSKIYRREMLNREMMRFFEGLHYAEDSAFNAILSEIVPRERIGKIKAEAPLYLWCYRKGSVTTNPENEKRNAIGFIDRNERVTEEFIQRGIDPTAMIGRTFWDGWCAAHPDKDKPEIVAAVEERFAQVAPKWRETFAKVPEETMDLVRKAAMKGAGKKDTEGESMEQWLRRICNDHKGKE